jgi:hypothetical protein
MNKQIEVCAARLSGDDRDRFVALQEEASRLLLEAAALRREAWALYRERAARDDRSEALPRRQVPSTPVPLSVRVVEALGDGAQSGRALRKALGCKTDLLGEALRWLESRGSVVREGGRQGVWRLTDSLAGRVWGVAIPDSHAYVRESGITS